MNVKFDVEYKLIRFGNDDTVAVQVDHDGHKGIVASNRGSLGWNLLDAEVYVFAAIKVIEAEGMTWKLHHWKGKANWKERKALYQKVYDELGMVTIPGDDPWDVGAQIYAWFQEHPDQTS